MTSPRTLAVFMLLLLVPTSSFVSLPWPHIPTYDFPFVATQPVSPPYAFDGAYANYTLTYYTNTGPHAYMTNYTISNVNDLARTFSVMSTYNSYLAPFGAVDVATFEQPVPFPAASPSQLELFKQGKLPLIYQGDNVSAGVVVTVPAGTFKTYQVEAYVSTVWFDMLTGLLVQEKGLMLGSSQIGFVGLVLASTNVKPAGQADNERFTSTAISTGAIVTCLVVLLSFERRARPGRRPDERPASEQRQEQQRPVFAESF